MREGREFPCSPCRRQDFETKNKRRPTKYAKTVKYKAGLIIHFLYDNPASPEVLAGTVAIFEVVKSVPVSQDDLPLEHPRYQLACIMAIPAHS